MRTGWQGDGQYDGVRSCDNSEGQACPALSVDFHANSMLIYLTNECFLQRAHAS
jgi:hypothetical protein